MGIIERYRQRRENRMTLRTDYSPDQPREENGRFGEVPDSEKAENKEKEKEKPEGGKKREPISTSSALRDKILGNHNSLSDNIYTNGRLPEERKEMHDRILDDIFKGKVPAEGTPQVVMLGGGPASGKTTSLEAGKASGEIQLPDEKSRVELDSDRVMSQIDGYKEMASQTDEAANYYHHEAAELTWSAYNEALSGGYDVVYDSTGDGKERDFLERIDLARQAGCAVNAVYSTCDIETAVMRNQERYEKGLELFQSGKSDVPPRWVPDEDVRSIHRNVTDLLVKHSGKFDSLRLYDTNSNGKPVLIATCDRDGMLKCTEGNRDALQKFLDKGRIKAYIDKDGTVKIVN